MSPDTPDVSVVIVTYNSEDDIRACLSGLLLNKDSYKLQILIIDNASKDNTIAVVDDFNSSQIDEQLRLVTIKNKNNLGFTAALNQGLAKAEGRFVLVLNPDASMKAGSLSKMISNFADPEVAVVAPQLLNPDGSIQPSCRRFPRRRDLICEISGLSYLFSKSPRFNYWKMADFDHDHRSDVDQPQGACLLFPKTILDEAGLWDEAFPMFFSDVDWCARVKQHGYKVRFEPDAKVEHKKGTSIYRHRTQMIVSSHKSFMLYLKKYRPNFILVNQIFAAILWIAAFVRILLFQTKNLLSKPNKKGN